MAKSLSPKQVARALDVSETSLKRWCDRGLIRSTKTGGGHRRLLLDSVLRFVHDSGRNLTHPELLDLPARSGTGRRTLQAAQGDLLAALLAGDEARSTQVLLDLRVAGSAISQIGDDVVAPAFHQIGEAWACGGAEVYQERRAVETCTRALHALRQTLSAPPVRSPLALGGSPERDPYSLPNALVELVLQERGWQARSLGCGLPFSTLASAIEQLRPRLFWLSVSHIDDQPRFLREYREFFARVKDKVLVAVGGQALTAAVRRQLQYTAFCDNLRHLEGIADAAIQSPQNRRPAKTDRRALLSSASK